MAKNTTGPTESISQLGKAEKGTPRYKRIKWTIFLAGISVFMQLYDFQALLGAVSDELPSKVVIWSLPAPSGWLLAC